MKYENIDFLIKELEIIYKENKLAIYNIHSLSSLLYDESNLEIILIERNDEKLKEIRKFLIKLIHETIEKIASGELNIENKINAISILKLIKNETYKSEISIKQKYIQNNDKEKSTKNK